MKPACSSKRRHATAFTLIELLTVMAIIIILAGLILGTAGYAQGKAARSRAQGEIKGLETAINSYQVDNGSVPRSSDTDSLTTENEPRASAAGSGSPAAYQTASLFLFRSLSGYYDITQSPPTLLTSGTSKIYFPFKGNQLAPSGTSTTSATRADGSINASKVTYISDPFGQSYGYSTAALAEADAANAKGTPLTSQTKGFNPTFDLWSTSGYGPGKPYPSTTAVSDKSSLWITNWSTQ